MKQLIYQVCVGPQSKLYKHCTSSVEQYAKVIGADYICQTEPKLKINPDPLTTNRSVGATRLGYLPIFEKENAFDYFDRYDQIAIIDADVWIRPGSKNVFKEVPVDQYDFGGVLERDMPITVRYLDKMRNYSLMQFAAPPECNLFNWDHPGGADFYNMGIMVCNKSMHKFMHGLTPYEFITQPKFKPFIDGIGNWKWSTDQTLLNVWVKEERMRTKNLSFHFNALFSAIPNKRIKQSYFVHFFLKDRLPDHGDNVTELMRYVE